MTTEMFINVMLGILAFISAGLSSWSLRMILQLNDRLTRLEQDTKSHKEDTERRFKEAKEELDRRFNEKRDDVLREKLLFEYQIKTMSEKQTDSQQYLKDEIKKVEDSVNLVHRRLDEYFKTNHQQ